MWSAHPTLPTDWTNNITLDTKVLPYRDDLRLLVVHVRSKNPRNDEFGLSSKAGDSFELRFRQIATDKKEKTVVDEDEGELITKVDLMKHTGGKVSFCDGISLSFGGGTRRAALNLIRTDMSSEANRMPST